MNKEKRLTHTYKQKDKNQQLQRNKQKDTNQQLQRHKPTVTKEQTERHKPKVTKEQTERETGINVHASIVNNVNPFRQKRSELAHLFGMPQKISNQILFSNRGQFCPLYISLLKL